MSSNTNETVKEQFISILVEEGFTVNETQARDNLTSLENPDASEIWFGNGVAEFKLVRKWNGAWVFHNFRNHSTKNASIKRLTEFFGQ